MAESPARLREVPWAALAGLGPALEEPLRLVLSGSPAERVLDRTLRAHRDFTEAQRRVVAESLFGVGLWRRRLRAQCGLPSPSPLQLLCVLAEALGGQADASQRLGLESVPVLPPPADWPSLHSLPDWLATLLTEEAGDEASQLSATLNLPGPICLRVNRLKTSLDALARSLAANGIVTRPGRWSPDALIVETPRPNLFGLEGSRLGHFEVQDEGSQLLGLAVGARPGDEVLELCAGAGGKTLQLASLMEGQGALHVADLDLSRLDRLRTRAEKAGAVVLIHGREPPASLRVARVLVDAPCSELGALRRGPDLRWRLDPATFDAFPALQLRLLERAASHVAPSGRLVYATCTLRHEENEDVVARFLAAHPSFTVVRPQLPAEVLDPGGFLRTLPHRHGTDGFFAAALARSG